MKASPLAVAGVALASTAHAQIVQLEIEKRTIAPGQGLTRRANPIDTTIVNDQTQGGYFITVNVGTPGQKLSLQLDTGSSDVWVPYSQSAICVETSDQNPGCTLGSFDPKKSSTFNDIGPNLFDISYVDNSGAKGDYFQDQFQISGVTVKNLTMGLGLKSTIAYGLIGVGYASNEASLATTQSTYPNLPIAMQEQGLINTIAYSLWLNDLDSSKGSILFGGIDTGKYVGDLTKLNIVRAEKTTNFTEFSVDLYSVQAVSPSGTDTLSTSEPPVIAVLDSGTTLTYLPQDMAEQAWQEVGAVYNKEVGVAVLPCSYKNHAGYFSFQFAGPNGPKINVTMDELVLDFSKGGQPPQFTSGPYRGQSVCEFGIQNQTSTPYLLGDTFLRSAYVVYDLVNNAVAIAPTNFNSTKSNIVAFPSQGAPIPSATLVADSTSPPPAPTKTSLSAASGFQSSAAAGSGSGSNGSNGNGKDNAAALMSIFSGPGMVVVGLSIAYTLVGSAVFGIGWL